MNMPQLVPTNVSLSFLGSPVRITTVDPAAAGRARRVVAGCLAAVREAADPFRSRGGAQRLAAAGGRPLVVDPLFGDLVLAALDAARATDGLLDPTVGNAALRLRRLNDGDSRTTFVHPHLVLVPTCGGGTATATAEAAVGWRRVEHVGARIAAPAGTLLDVTAVAAPFLAIAASVAAARRTGTGVLVDVGGDIAHHGAAPVGGWRVPLGDGETLRLGVGWALSSVRPTGIVDPASGHAVAPVWRRVSVLGRDAISAKAAAVAAHVLGENAPQWLADHGFAARLERTDGATVALPGWPSSPVPQRRRSGPQHLAPAS